MYPVLDLIYFLPATMNKLAPSPFVRPTIWRPITKTFGASAPVCPPPLRPALNIPIEYLVL